MGSKQCGNIAVQEKPRPDHQRSVSAGFDKWLQVSRNLRRRKLVEPVLVPSRLELPFLDCVVQDKASNSIKQNGNNPYLRNSGRLRERADRLHIRNDYIDLK
jgi:hypothetical protein